MSLKEKIASKKLSKIAASIKRDPEVLFLDTVKKVGVIWQPPQKEAFFFLQDFFNKKQAIFRGLCIYDDRPSSLSDSGSLIPKDLNWLGFPKPGKIDTFTEFHFDLLISIALQQNVTLDYITLVTEAKFKTGWSPEKNNFFDLNINIGQNQDALFLAKQQIFYLGQLKKNAS